VSHHAGEKESTGSRPHEGATAASEAGCTAAIRPRAQTCRAGAGCGFQRNARTVSAAYASTYDPKLLPSLGVVGPEDASGGYRLPPDFFKFTADPASQIDWLAMRQPFLTRGVMVGDLELKTIEQNWRFTYTSMVNLGLSPELSVKIANIGTPLAYDFSLARDNPTAEERMDQAFEKMLPPGEKLPTKIVVPVITPDTLQWVTKKVTGKDIDFRF
jgi:hypothetical protein